MICVKTPHRSEYLVKKSRFIGLLFPSVDEQQVRAEISRQQQAFADASHVVYAYRLQTPQGVVYRFHDAGEPTGTAGKPIFQQMEGKHLINALLVVVRYFGGIKLGAGGLTRAYSQTASQVIAGAELGEYIEWVTVPLTLAYTQIQPLEYLLKKLDGRIISQDFTGQVQVQVQIPAEQAAVLREAFKSIA